MQQKQYIPWYKNIDWASTLFLLGLPVFCAVAIPIYFYFNEWQWSFLVFFLIFYGASTLGITAGYHRCLAHRAYDANSILKFYYLFFGAASAFQGSAVEWCSDHRRHHNEVDTDGDPYNIRRGFFYAHLGWMLEKYDPERETHFGPDLLRDKMTAFQHKYYIPIAIFACFILPLLIGFAFGAPFGMLLIAGGLRLVLAHHATFFINSLCHTLGDQPYNEDNTAKDSLIMAFLTQGEGYHNFHHKFEGDYRNGIRWYDYDPTKWFIQLMSVVGWAKNLKRTPASIILKSKLRMDQKRLAMKGISQEKLEGLRKSVESAQARFRELQQEYRTYKKQWKHDQKQRLWQLRREYRYAKAEFKLALAQWQELKRYGLSKGVAI